MDETKYELNMFREKGAWEVKHVKINSDHSAPLPNAVAKIKELFPNAVVTQSNGNDTQQVGKTCYLHNVPMEQKWSEKKKKTYFAHMSTEGMCFGN